MKRLIVIALTAVVLGGCSSAAAPGADNVLKQVDKARELEQQVEDRNAELDAQP